MLSCYAFSDLLVIYSDHTERSLEARVKNHRQRGAHVIRPAPSAHGYRLIREFPIFPEASLICARHTPRRTLPERPSPPFAPARAGLCRTVLLLQSAWLRTLVALDNVFPIARTVTVSDPSGNDLRSVTRADCGQIIETCRAVRNAFVMIYESFRSNSLFSTNSLASSTTYPPYLPTSSTWMTVVASLYSTPLPAPVEPHPGPDSGTPDSSPKST